MKISENIISLLYVDDEPLLLDLTKEFLERTGNFIVDTAFSAKEGLKKIQEREYDAVISDYQMPETDGLEFLKILRITGNDIPFIIFTGRGREEVAIEALNAGADYYLQKGGQPKVQFGELSNFLRKAVDKCRAEKALLEHEQRMSDVINFLPDATFAIDTKGTIIAWNRAIEEITGISASEMIGKGNYEYALPFYGCRRPVLIDLVLHEDLQKEVSYPIINCENKKKIFAEIFLPHLREGKGAYLWFTASPLYDTEGNISGVIESIRDITDYKLAEGLYKTVFENTGTAMVIVEEDATILHVNEKMKDLLGYSWEEAVGLMKCYDQVVDEDMEKMLEYHRLRRTDPDSVPKSYDCRLIHKNGDKRVVTITAAMIPGTKKSILSLIDITEQKEKERMLRFTKFSVDNAPEGIIWADEEGRFFSANKSAIEIYGYPQEELFKMSIPDFAPDFPYSRFKEFWHKAKEKGSITFDTSVIKKDGTSVIIELSVAFLNFEDQEYECGFARDITARKNFENTLKTLNKKLTLLSSITRHDINNQISVIMGYEELMESVIIDEKGRKYLKSIIEATEKIQKQITFTHDYQEIGVNSPSWQQADFVVHSAASNLHNNVIKIKNDTGKLEIYADHMLEKVFYSIFENALRHGGHVTEIDISFHEKEGQGILVIEDNGKGIEDNMKGIIFERGVGSNTGLGLFLAKEILDITGISISETGKEGKGARFEIVVPKSGYRFKK